MENTHSYWNNNYMGMVPGVDGKSRIEIDESKLITFDNNIRWMFGLVDRNKYDIRLFFVNNNRVKETLLLIIIKNVYIYQNILNNNEGKNAEYLATRIYRDCLQTYQKKILILMLYILYKVNHSVWFGTGNFHTNTIEGVCISIKRITNSFNGMNGSIYNKFQNNEIEYDNYINGWICAALYYMRCEHFKLGDNAKIELLSKYLKSA